MERNSKTTLLLLLPALLQVCKIQNGSSSTIQHESLTCYNDYNANITCIWDSTNASDLAGKACKVHAQRVEVRPGRRGYKSSCILEPADISRPALKKCSLIFTKDGTFMFHHVLSISLNCSPVVMSYKPVSHIKLYPPGKPLINYTTVSWFSQVIEEGRLLRITQYTSELQWKPEEESWSGPSVQKKETLCDLSCEASLDPDLLIRHTRYEARVRVKPSQYESFWSDWSPTASWVSSNGKPGPPSPDNTAGVFWRIVVGTAAVAFFLVILFKTDKTWVYVVAKIRGPLLPDPGKSFLQDVNFQTWLSPHFSSESFHSLLKPEEISSVEVTCSVDSVAPRGPEAAPQERVRNKSRKESTSSSFFNPSYSQMCPPVTVLTAGNLERSAADTTSCPFRTQDKSKTTEQEMEEEKGKQLEILHMFSKGNITSECLQVTSDYEKVEKIEVERLRLQSLDSGVCSGEEVSQESLEADSIIVTGGDDEEGEEEETRNEKDLDFQTLFRRRGSIQVCYDYERVQELLPDTTEPHSLDSGASSEGGEQISSEDKSTNFLFPPSCTAPSRSMPSCTPPPPLSFSGSNLNPCELETTALPSTSGSLEPSDDDYIHV